MFSRITNFTKNVKAKKGVSRINLIPIDNF